MSWRDAGHLCLSEADWHCLADLPDHVGVQVFRFQARGRTLWFLSTIGRDRKRKWDYADPFYDDPPGASQFVAQFCAAVPLFCAVHDRMVHAYTDFPVCPWQKVGAFSLGWQLASLLQQQVFNFVVTEDYENLSCVQDPKHGPVEIVFELGYCCRCSGGKVRFEQVIPDFVNDLEGISAAPPPRGARKVGVIQHSLDNFLGEPMIRYEGLVPLHNRLTLVAQRSPSGKMKLLEDTTPRSVGSRSSVVPPKQVEEIDYPLGGSIHTLIGTHLLLSDFKHRTVILDLSSWPPLTVIERRDIYCWWASAAPDGRRVLLAKHPDDTVFGLLQLQSASDPGKMLFLEERKKRIDLHWAGFLGDEILVVAEGRRPPYLVRDGAFVPVPGLPPATSTLVEIGLIPLVGGKTLLRWQGYFYQYLRKKFVQGVDLKIRSSAERWTSVPRTKDSFFYLSDRKLFEYRPRGKPIRHATKWQNGMYVRPGPDGSILVQQGYTPEGDVARLYFPKEKTAVFIGPDMFNQPEADHVWDFICWSSGSDHIVSGKYGKLRAVAASHVLGFARQPVEG